MYCVTCGREFECVGKNTRKSTCPYLLNQNICVCSKCRPLYFTKINNECRDYNKPSFIYR